MREPKILFLPSLYDGCYYYRGYLPGVYSDSMVVGDFISKQFDKDIITEQAKKADIIVIQRPNELMRANLAKSLKAMGKKIVFDNDDTYLPDKGIPMHLLDNDKQRDIARQMSKFLNDTLRISDGAIASTEILANEYREINPNTIVLKNCVDPMDAYPCKENKTGKFRIGLIGSVTTNDDYIHIKEQLKRLDETNEFTIVVFGLKYQNGNQQAATKEDNAFFASLKNVEWQPFVPVNEYYLTIANLALDLAIIPRKEHYFNQCKSNLKFLEMSLLKIPVLAQGFSDGTSPYQGIDEKYMTIVNDNDTWYEKIIEIRDNIGRYRELANKANYYVLRNYNVKKFSEEWKRQIINLVK
jgi:glycosyltransferase involved in cell wall biosynthesis